MTNRINLDVARAAIDGSEDAIACLCDTAWIEDIDELAHALCNEVEGLRAIVDKLPKCWRLGEDGKLVQDVPIELGSTVWRYAEDGTFEECFVQAVYRRKVLFAKETRDGYGGAKDDRCYSSRAAVEAAGRKP